jgi:hypothetical protein
MRTRWLWRSLYIAAALFALWSGYESLAPQQTVHTDADWVFVCIVFAVMCVFPVGMMAYGLRTGVQQFRRPSLDRHPFSWWHDTLQPLRVVSVGTALTFVGACFALRHTDHRGLMMFWFYAALAIGVFIGERIVYLVYRERIA